MLEVLSQNAEDVEKKGTAPILKLRTDSGSEFAGSFSALLAGLEIEMNAQRRKRMRDLLDLTAFTALCG